MPNNTLLTDDFVAELLAKEASEASIKYSSMGLEAFRSTKPLNKAKPNTRFLNRIIKETTNHNHALRAKETAEAQARLDSLTEAEEKKRQRLNPTASDIRRRQLGTISSILHGGKRRDRDEPEKGKHGREESLSKHRQKVKVREEKDRDSSLRPRRKDDEEDEQSSSKHHRHHNRSSDRSRSPVQRERSRRKYRDRSPLSSDEDRRSHRTSKSHGKKPEKDRDSHRRSGESSRHKRHSRSGDYDHSRPQHTRERHEDHLDDGDSDPLDDLIGPPPPPKSPVRVRGRGAMKGPADMDKRFSEGYNAASDTQLDIEEDAGTGGDWDEALELFRERQKWKQQGADRLRAAGFTEEQIKKWEKGGEKDIDDVRWAKRGEQREWDRGKEIDDSDFD